MSSNWYDPAEPSLLNMPTEPSESEVKKDEENPVADEIRAQERWNEAVKRMSMCERLSYIQNEMKVPKNLYNSHGGYYYRNAETIMNTAKPICAKYRCTLTVDDAINQIGDRFYVSATALLSAWDSMLNIACTAHARETLDRKGMDSSQITGAASSYARKYALNGLFLLDDVKDADTDEYVEQTKEQKKEQPKQKAKQPDVSELILKFQELKGKLTKIGVDIHADAFVKWLCENAKVGTTDPGKLKPEELDRVVKCMDSALKAKQK